MSCGDGPLDCPDLHDPATLVALGKELRARAEAAEAGRAVLVGEAERTHGPGIWKHRGSFTGGFCEHPVCVAAIADTTEAERELLAKVKIGERFIRLREPLGKLVASAQWTAFWSTAPENALFVEHVAEFVSAVLAEERGAV